MTLFLAPPKKSANIAAFDALSQLNNNDFKGLDFWKSKVDMGKMAENSWFLMGGRGVKTPTKRYFSSKFFFVHLQFYFALFDCNDSEPARERAHENQLLPHPAPKLILAPMLRKL